MKSSKMYSLFSRLLAVLLGMTVVFMLFFSSVSAGSAADILEDELETQSEEVSTNESAGAPPELFTVYIQVGDGDPIEFTSYTGTEMRTIARKYNTDSTTLKYSAQSYYGTAGRVVTEYITLTDFFSYVSDDVSTLDYTSGDYVIMDEDLTKDEDYINAGYSKEELMGNWYSYDSLIGTTRYYFPNWSSGSESGAEVVPAVIGIRSYGGSSGMSDTMLDIYASSADFLWAYVIYYGQTTYTEYNYPYFYYGQTQMIVRYEETSAVNSTVSSLLEDTLEEAKDMLANTIVGTTSDTVSQGTYWVTQQLYTALEEQVSAAQEAQTDSATNGSIYEAYESLREALDDFEDGRTAGEKSGYFWYTETEGDTYVITTGYQLYELACIVNGIAADTSTGESFDQFSFEGKTILLGNDIDMTDLRACIGNESYAFEGTFDGQGYTISNVGNGYSRSSYRGLFGNIGESGIVMNFTITGSVSVTNSNEYTGGIAGYNSGTIENIVCDQTVSAPSTYTGGIAGYNEGTITDCTFLGSVYGDSQTAGIAGYNAGTITGCINAGTAELNDGTTAASAELAGISASNTGTITGCIDTQLSLAGANTGTLSCSYTLSDTAVITAGGTISNVYCLGGSTEADGVTVISEAEDFTADSVLKALNSGSEEFVSVSGGYPALSRQTIYTLYFELLLDDNVMDPIGCGEYLPLIKPADPAAVKYDDSGELVNDTAYTFAGWYADEELTEEYDFTALLTGDSTAYAAWTAPDLGDVDLDGDIDDEDAQLVLEYTAGNAEFSDAQLEAADVSGDGKVNTKDAILIKRFAAGVISEF